MSLADDRIIAKGPFGTRMLMAHEIKGYKIDENYIHAVPVEGCKKKIRISTYMEKNQEIRDWFSERFFNLDTAANIREEKQILGNEEFGITEESRGRKLKEAKIVAKVVNAISWLVMGWLLFYPRPYDVAIVVGMVFPLAA